MLGRRADALPLLTVLAVPVFVVAATRLVNDLEAVQDSPSEEETAAIIAAEEMAAAVALLASDQGGFFVGATLDLNGGLYVR